MANKKKSKSSARSKIRIVINLVIVLGVILTMAFFYIRAQYETFLKTPLTLGGEQERLIQIPRGSTARDVVHILHQAGAIQSYPYMYWCLRQSALSSKLQPGNVVLTPDMTPSMLPEVLAHVGKYARRSIRIRAGMNLYDIAQALQANRMVDAKTFLAKATDPFTAAENSIPAKRFEGYIAPGIYTFEMDTPPEKMLAVMHERWRKTWTSLIEENRGAYEMRQRKGYDDHALLTLASMVEKEAVQDKERPVIARVFFNRLAKKMKLQSDPTCVYPPKKLGEKPTPARCKDPENTYSTYMIEALPPGPITTVSEASMRAVFEPYQGPDNAVMLYFVAKNDGSWTHYFSKTYREHQIAVDHFLKGKKSKPSGTTQPVIK
ncbi:MAG: endolytic transglycosylase MltG [Proteobacteria bacterium]|nr:endolytic transglycosylase MltG [Pseudomonadota bacterium]